MNIRYPSDSEEERKLVNYKTEVSLPIKERIKKDIPPKKFRRGIVDANH